MSKKNTENFILWGAVAIGVGLIVKHLVSAFERDDDILSKEGSKILSNPKDKKTLLEAINTIEKDNKLHSKEIELSSGKKIEIVM